MYLTKVDGLQIIDDFSMFLELKDFKNFECSGIPDKMQLQREAVLLLAKDGCWEGDGTFYILPDISSIADGYPRVKLLIKQYNNGETFLIY